MKNPIPWGAVGLLLLFAFFFAWHIEARAEPLFQAVSEDKTTRIILHSDPCKLEAVSNLPKRATFVGPDGKGQEGCWRINARGWVLIYFEDRVIIGLPGSAFDYVAGA